MKPDYPFIRADCHFNGSMPYWLEAQLGKARKDKAPHDAVTWDDNENRWRTIAEYPDTPYRANLYHYASQLSTAVPDGGKE